MKFFSFICILIFTNELNAIYNDENGEDTDYDHNSNSIFPQQLTLNDWDSSLYGKPICTTIPSNMSLCTNINYDQMKVPNLIGHESVEEVCRIFYIHLFFI
jgi:hypothetical protein